MKTKVLKVLVTVLLLSLAASAAQGADSIQGSDGSGTDGVIYRYQRADTPRLFSWMSGRSLKVDTTGKSHIAYGSDHLYYASKLGSSSTWNVEVVDGSYNTGMFASLALDSANRPHISYYDAVGGSLKYAFFNGTVWTVQAVDDYGGLMAEDPVVEEDLDAGSYVPGLDTLRDSYGPISPTLGITSTSELSPTLAPDLVLPRPDEAEVPPVTPYGVGLYTSIAIDSNDRPGISYYDAAQGALKFARWDGARWVIQLVDNADDTGRFTSLVFDSTGKPQISYYNATNKDLRFAKWLGSAWSLSVVDDGGSTGDVGQFSSIAIDLNGYTHISYYDVINSSLKHAKLTSSWSKETVTGSDSTDVGMYSSIALPKTGSRIYISYFDATNSNLKYAIWIPDSSTWQINNVALGDVIGRYTSASLDPNTKLHISYYDSGLGQLREAYIDTGASSTLIDNAHDVGYYADMAVDASYNFHIAYHDDIQDDLRYAKWNGVSWTVQVIDPDSEGGMFNSIAVDTDGHPHISYYDYDADALKYAKWNGSNWEITSLTSWIGIGSRGDVDTGMSTAIALDPTNNYPRIAYYRGGSDLPYFTLYNGTSWTTPIAIDTGSDRGRYIDMKVDSTGNIHISYMIGSGGTANQYLRYVKLDSSGNRIGDWVTVDDGSTGFFNNMTLQGNFPHIAYFNDVGDNLKHAWYDGTWHNENVDTTAQSAGWFPSIAVAPSGLVYITYYDASYDNLKLAVKSGATWTLNVIDSVGDVGKFSAAGINADGLLSAAYSDVSNGDLKWVDQFDFNATDFIYLPFISK